MAAMDDAYQKLAALSEERAQRVIALINELSEVELRENAEDLAVARAALDRIAKGEKTYPWKEVQNRLSAISNRDR